MNREISELLRLREVLASIGSGMGVSASIVKILRTGEKSERNAARLVLLGNPPAIALTSVPYEKSKELAMLTGIIAGASGSSARLLGRKGEKLSAIVEGWLKAKESRVLESRVLQVRGYIMSAVLGAVMAILSTLGPVVGSITLLQAGPPPSDEYISYASGVMVAFSSTMLGVYLGGRRFYVNLGIACAVFILGTAAAAPLASFPAAGLWAIK